MSIDVDLKLYDGPHQAKPNMMFEYGYDEDDADGSFEILLPKDASASGRDGGFDGAYTILSLEQAEQLLSVLSLAISMEKQRSRRRQGGA